MCLPNGISKRFTSSSAELDLGLVSTSTPVGALHGLVLDARHPSIRLGGARVSMGRFFQAIATFPQGEYLLPYVPSGIVYGGTATVDGYAPGSVAGVETVTGQTLELDWPLTSLSDEAQGTYSLTVTVLEAGSLLPLAGAIVSAGAFGVQNAVTSTEGIAVLSGLLGGMYTLTASLAGYRVGAATAIVSADGAARLLLRGFPASYTGGEVFGYVTSALLPPGQDVPDCLVSVSPTFTGGWTGPDVLTDANGFYVVDNVPAGTVTLTFDEEDYAPLPVSGIVVGVKAAIRVDAALSPWDGRLPAGWRVFMSEAKSLSRPPASSVTTLPKETRTSTILRQGDTLALIATEDTRALGRFRRVRYDVRTATPSGNPVVKTAVGLAPGVSLPSPPETIVLGVPRAKNGK